MAISKSTKNFDRKRKKSQRKSCNLDFAILNSLTQDAITSSKLKYSEHLANKLNDLKAAPRTYWKILKNLTMVLRFH